MSESAAGPNRSLRAIRIAVLATALALVLGLALLIHEDPYLFTAFMVLGPLLLAAAFLLLGWTIVQDLRDKKVL